MALRHLETSITKQQSRMTVLSHNSGSSYKLFKNKRYDSKLFQRLPAKQPLSK